MYQALFLGLNIDPDHILKIADWRSNALGYSSADVKPHNFHVTLAFLGQVTSHQLDALLEVLPHINWLEFTAHFDHVGYWGKPKIHFIAPSIIPDELKQLAKQCQTLSRKAGIQIEKREYRPHITLQRKIKEPVPALYQPSFRLSFKEFHLFESISTATGVAYIIRESFSAHPDPTMSVRERISKGLL